MCRQKSNVQLLIGPKTYLQNEIVPFANYSQFYQIHLYFTPLHSIVGWHVELQIKTCLLKPIHYVSLDCSFCRFKSHFRKIAAAPARSGSPPLLTTRRAGTGSREKERGGGAAQKLLSNNWLSLPAAPRQIQQIQTHKYTNTARQPGRRREEQLTFGAGGKLSKALRLFARQ